jgi:hypothetical protein
VPDLLYGGTCTPECLFGSLARPEDAGELPTGVVELGGPVDWDSGVEVPQVFGRRNASVAELVDAVSERVSCLRASGDDLSPVVVKLAVQAGDVVLPPALGRLEALQDPLFVAQPADAAGNVIPLVPGGASPLGVVAQLVLHQAALLSPSSRQPGQRAHRRQPGGRPGNDCLSVGQAALGCLEVLGRRGKDFLAANRPVRQHSFVFGDPLAELAVEDPGVAAGGQGWVGVTGKRPGNLVGRPPLVGEGTAVVDDGDPGGVPGVGGLAGTGLAGVAPVGVQGGAAKQVAGLPGATLRPVDGTGPGVREVGRTVLAGALRERRRQAHSFSTAVEQDGEPSFCDGGHCAGSAVDERGARGAAAGVEEHPVPRPVLPLRGPPGADQGRAGESTGGCQPGSGPIRVTLAIQPGSYRVRPQSSETPPR